MTPTVSPVYKLYWTLVKTTFRVWCLYSYLVHVAHHDLCPEPVFVNLLSSPGIDPQPDRPVRQLYFSYRPVWLHRLAESIPRNRFLGSLNVYKYGLSGGGAESGGRKVGQRGPVHQRLGAERQQGRVPPRHPLPLCDQALSQLLQEGNEQCWRRLFVLRYYN